MISYRSILFFVLVSLWSANGSEEELERFSKQADEIFSEASSSDSTPKSSEELFNMLKNALENVDKLTFVESLIAKKNIDDINLLNILKSDECSLDGLSNLAQAMSTFDSRFVNLTKYLEERRDTMIENCKLKYQQEIPKFKFEHDTHPKLGLLLEQVAKVAPVTEFLLGDIEDAGRAIEEVYEKFFKNFQPGGFFKEIDDITHARYIETKKTVESAVEEICRTEHVDSETLDSMPALIHLEPTTDFFANLDEISKKNLFRSLVCHHLKRIDLEPLIDRTIIQNHKSADLYDALYSPNPDKLSPDDVHLFMKLLSKYDYRDQSESPKRDYEIRVRVAKELYVPVDGPECSSIEARRLTRNSGSLNSPILTNYYDVYGKKFVHKCVGRWQDNLKAEVDQVYPKYLHDLAELVMEGSPFDFGMVSPVFGFDAQKINIIGHYLIPNYMKPPVVRATPAEIGLEVRDRFDMMKRLCKLVIKHFGKLDNEFKEFPRSFPQNREFLRVISRENLIYYTGIRVCSGIVENIIYPTQFNLTDVAGPSRA